MKILTLAIAMALLSPAVAFADCQAVAGKHGGSFTIDKREDTKDGNHPDSVRGTWTATIDGATCAVTGEATSPLTGTVALTGKFGAYNPDTSKFKVTNLYMDAAGNPDFIQFVFKTDSAKHLLHDVEVETSAYLYVGDFDGK